MYIPRFKAEMYFILHTSVDIEHLELIWYFWFLKVKIIDFFFFLGLVWLCHNHLLIDNFAFWQ